MKVMTTTTMAIRRSEVTWTTSTTCGGDGVATHCTFRCFSECNKCHETFHYVCLVARYIILVIRFTHYAMRSFHCVVNNDPGVDKYTQEGLEVNSGFSQSPTATHKESNQRTACASNL